MTFVAGLVLGDLAQPEGFSPANDNISDVGAQTAEQAWLYNQIAANLNGFLIVAFALGLWRALGSSWLARLGVLGLAILTPVFVADLQEAQVPAQEAITSLVLDAPLTARDKVSLARALGDELTDQQGQVPDLHGAFVAADLEPDAGPAAADLEHDLDDQLERAVTRAFRDSFLVGAGLALLALLTVVAPHRRRSS